MLQLCITINDIEQVRRSLKPLPDALKFSDIIFAVEKFQGEKSSKAARLALVGIVSDTDDEMIHKIKHVVDRVADKVWCCSLFRLQLPVLEMGNIRDYPYACCFLILTCLLVFH